MPKTASRPQERPQTAKKRSSSPPEDVQDGFQGPQAAQERRQSAHESPTTAQEPIRPSEGPLFDEFAPGLPWCWGARGPSGGPRGPQEAAKKAQ